MNTIQTANLNKLKRYVNKNTSVNLLYKTLVNKSTGVNKTNNNSVVESLFNYSSVKHTPTYPWWNNWRQRQLSFQYCPSVWVYSRYDSNRHSRYKCMDFGYCPGPGYNCCRYDNK
jgi:hypothetical protein